MNHEDLVELQLRACRAMGKILAAQFKGGESISTLAKNFRLEESDVEFLIRHVIVVKP